MSGSCGCSGQSAKFDGMSTAYKRTLWTVVAINAVMFGVELIAGAFADSQALKADALDFLGDSLTYGLSLAVIGLSLRARALAAIAKGISLLVMGLVVLGLTLTATLSGSAPEPKTMGVIGLIALAANLVSVMLLIKYKDGDANVRSVWLCSRNDAIGNIAVMLAALGVFGAGSAAPDLIVAGLMAALFTHSAISILRQAWSELRHQGRLVMAG